MVFSSKFTNEIDSFAAKISHTLQYPRYHTECSCLNFTLEIPKKNKKLVSENVQFFRLRENITKSDDMTFENPVENI